MRVRVAFWQFDDEHYGAMVLLPQGRSIFAAGSSMRLLGYALDQSIDREYGPDWTVASFAWLGRLAGEVTTDVVMEAWENAA